MVHHLLGMAYMARAVRGEECQRLVWWTSGDDPDSGGEEAHAPSIVEYEGLRGPGSRRASRGGRLPPGGERLKWAGGSVTEIDPHASAAMASNSVFTNLVFNSPRSPSPSSSASSSVPDEPRHVFHTITIRKTENFIGLNKFHRRE
jgi:hypothetical protein